MIKKGSTFKIKDSFIDEYMDSRQPLPVLGSTYTDDIFGMQIKVTPEVLDRLQKESQWDNSFWGEIKGKVLTCVGTRNTRGTRFITFQHGSDEDGASLFHDVAEEECEKL